MTNAILMMFHYCIDYVLDLLNYFNGYRIVAIVTNSITKKDLESDKRCIQNGIEIVTDFKQITKDFDVVLLSEKGINDEQFASIITTIKDHHKKIVRIDTYANNKTNPLFNQIPVPVISICRSNAGINATKMILDLREKFKSNNYSVGVMSASPVGKLLGFHWLDDNICEGNVIEKSIELMHQQIEQYVFDNCFDAIIIEYPGHVGDKNMFVINNAIYPSYSIVVTEALKLPNNYKKYHASEIEANYLGNVDLIVMSEYMFTFINNSVEFGARLSKQSLRKLSSGVYPTVFDINRIFNKIQKKLEIPEALVW